MLETNLKTLLPPRHKERTCLLDSNLLLLWITALVDHGLLTSMKRVRSFSKEDIALLFWLVDQFKSVAVTSYTLTEVSNLANELHGRVREAWFSALATYAQQTAEKHVTLVRVSSHPLFVTYGAADAALAELSSDIVWLLPSIAFPVRWKLTVMTW